MVEKTLNDMVNPKGKFLVSLSHFWQSFLLSCNDKKGFLLSLNDKKGYVLSRDYKKSFSLSRDYKKGFLLSRDYKKVRSVLRQSDVLGREISYLAQIFR